MDVTLHPIYELYEKYRKQHQNAQRENAYSSVGISGFLGVDQSFVFQIEKGEGDFPADMLEKLACLLGVPIEAIETGSVDLSNLPDFEIANLTSEDLKAINDISRIAINSEHMAALLSL